MAGEGSGRESREVRHEQIRLREALATGGRELALYLAAGAVYIAIGVVFPEFLFSWVVATGYLLLCVVVLPAFVRRLRRP